MAHTGCQAHDHIGLLLFLACRCSVLEHARLQHIEPAAALLCLGWVELTSSHHVDCATFGAGKRDAQDHMTRAPYKAPRRTS